MPRTPLSRRWNRSWHLVLAIVVLAAQAGCGTAPSMGPEEIAEADGVLGLSGFDEYGYNEIAGIFNGPADGVDRTLDGMVYGDPLYAVYAADHLLMKWNKAWDDCNDAGNNDPVACAGAWTINEWNGMVPGGSGETWHYKIIWIGSCGAEGTPLPDGGYCLWGTYEVIMSQGTFANEHFWDAHAVPTGLVRPN